MALLGNGLRNQRKSALYGLLLWCVLFAIMMWSACSSGGGTPSGTYNVTVTGTFSSGPANLVQSTKLTLVVQ